jgi:ABC-type branched-subunit amino acid transport system substrate-binding protein
MRCRALGAALVSLLSLCCSPAAKEPSDGVVLGLLLPFTGSESAVASNLERAVLYAVGRVNQGGGVKGHPLRVVSRDTHSDLGRARSSAAELIDAGAVVVIGPESPEIAADIRPLLTKSGVAFLSPLVGAADEPGQTCDAPWFRLAPSARSLGEALAKELNGNAVTSISLMYATAAYDASLRDAVEQRFTSLGGNIANELELNPGAQSYATEVRKAVEVGVDAVVLASSPRAAALAINEFGAVDSRPPRWFLSPLLKTDLLVENVAPDALEGAIGVAPKIYEKSEAFTTAFGRRWLGDTPLEGAYFYYDAVGLIAFGYEKADASEPGRVSLDALDAGIISAAAPPGEAAGWNEIEVGLERLRSGDDIYYSGLTGPLLLQACGSRRIGVTSSWSIHRGRISDDGTP